MDPNERPGKTFVYSCAVAGAVGFGGTALHTEHRFTSLEVENKHLSQDVAEIKNKLDALLIIVPRSDIMQRGPKP